MVDFTNCREEINTYKGSEKKKTLIYENHKYLVKFTEPIREKNKNISYINNAYSEYIGSHIFEMVGLKTQKTLLGKYKYDDKEKIVDALIGNAERDNGNWGFLVNKKTKETTLAPIFDYGSCLNPLLEDKDIMMFKDSDIKNLAINNYSCFKENGKKINYLSYLKEMENEDCNKALLRLFKKIKIDEILDFIDKIELSDIRKTFYKTILEYRYNILKEIYEKLGG